MPLLVPVDAARFAVVGPGGWHLVDAPAGVVVAEGEGEVLDGPAGRWELGGGRIRGPGVDQARSGPVAAAFGRVWVVEEDRLRPLDGEAPPLRAPGVQAFAVDAGGLSWASAERLVRLDPEGRPRCSLELRGAAPRAVAAGERWMALADERGLLLADVERCTPVAASSAVADALLFQGDQLYALTSGGLQVFDPSLDAPPGYLLGAVPLEGEAASVFTGMDLRGLAALPPAAGWSDAVVVADDGATTRVIDASGRQLAEDRSLPLPLVAFDVAHGAAVVSDGSAVRLLGAEPMRAEARVDDVHLLDAHTVAVRSGAAWTRMDFASRRSAPMLPLDAPIRIGEGVASWLPFGSAGHMGLRRVAGGLQVVDADTGRALGVELGVEARSAAVREDGRLVLTQDGTQLVAWETASGRAIWRRQDPREVLRVGSHSVELADHSRLSAATGEPGQRGRPELGTPAPGGRVADPAGLFAAVPFAAAPAAPAGWCGRGELLRVAFAPFPALRDRLVALAGACAADTPELRSVAVGSATTVDRACSGGFARPALELGPGRERLLTRPTARRPALPDAELWLLTEDPELAAAWGGSALSPRQPLPDCLEGFTEAAWIDAAGHVRALGALDAVLRAMRGRGVEAPAPALRMGAEGQLRGIAAIPGGVLVTGDGITARIDAEGRLRWAVPEGGSTVAAGPDFVITVSGRVVSARALEDGRWLWSTQARLDGVDGDVAVLLSRGQRIAVDRTGARRWAHAGPGRRLGGSWEAAVAGWSCRRDASFEPRECSRLQAEEPPWSLVDGRFSWERSRKEGLSLSGVRAVRALGRRLRVDGAHASWIVEEGRVLAALPPLDAAVVEGERTWTLSAGLLELYR